MNHKNALIVAGTLALSGTLQSRAGAANFGPANPFYAPSSLPFHAPPFDKIKNEDYQPAVEAGMLQQIAEIEQIADSAAPPTFENTYVAMEKSGRLLARALAAFWGVADANTNPTLQATKTALAPKLAAHQDAIHLNKKLFERIDSIYGKRDSLNLDPESKRLVEVVYDEFLHAGAKLSDTDKTALKKFNEQISTLSNDFSMKVLEATKDAAFATSDRAALAGLTEAELTAASQAAKTRKADGYVVPLQNTTQQPALASLSARATRDTIFHNSWNRTEHGDGNDTRATVARLAQLRAQRAKLLGYPSHAAWKLEDQMAKTPQAALAFMDALVPVATAKTRGEATDIQRLIDAQKGGYTLEPWDWDFFSEQVRRSKYDLKDADVKPYFELNRVLENGVFYAATELYGIHFTERKDIPVYQSDMRVFEVTDADGKPLALFYCDYFKRDNKNGGAWMSTFLEPSRLLHQLPVVYNVANLPKPAPGEPALISFSDVVTMFHEFGHALHGMFAQTRYPTLSGTTPQRDFVEFPSQFNEHWATYPVIFEHYARHYQTGAAMPQALLDKIKNAQTFNSGYALAEVLAAAQLDMQWHVLPADAPLQDSDAFEKQALTKTHMDLPAVPPRYRSSYFSHIFAGGYSAGYYAYLWTQMLDDDAYQWFDDHGGLTRANGDRFREMILAQGNTHDLAAIYLAWRGKPPTIDAMMKYRGLLTQ
jgi:peptidyl-dipeptidase Dcp